MIRRLSIAAVTLASFLALTSCGGGGTSFLGGSGLTSPGGGGSTNPVTPSGTANVKFSLTIPGPSSSATSSTATRIVSASVRKPATISSGTQSITVSVNGGTPQVFNTSSCSGSPNLTCQLSVGAAYGLDSFLILTYSGVNGTGTALNAAAVTLNVTTGGPNTASATAGNLLTVTSNGDSSGGSNSCAAGSTTCTLREAVAEASTTAGVYTALLFSGVTSITVASPITLNGQNMIVLGPGAGASNSAGTGAPSASSGLTISGGSATQIFYVGSGSSLMVDGVTLSGGNNSTDNSGGAIENYGSLAIVNTIFSGNGGSSTEYGGAVYDEGASPTSVSLSTFTNNTATYEGGAYYEDSGASFSRVIFNGNSAFDGEDYGAGGAIYAEWNLTVGNSTFTANVAGSTSVANVEGDGGAIFIDGNGVSPTITASTFGGSSSSAGNFAGGPGASARGEGGAIYNDGGNPLISSGNTFGYNTTKGGESAYGGAISDYDGVTSTGDTFTNNTSDATAAMSGCSMYAYGGAVYTENDDGSDSYSGSTWSNDTFTGNQALGTVNGTPYVYGGAIFDYYGGGITVTGSTFKNNTTNGGVGYADGGGLAVEDGYGSTTLTNDTFTSNTATTQSGSASGGGLEVDYAFITVSGLTVSNNSATITGTSTDNSAYGGGFEFYEGDEEDESVARKPSPLAAKRRTVAAKLAEHAARIFTYKQTKFTAYVSKKSKHAMARLSKRAAPNTSRQVQGEGDSPSSTIANTSFTNNTVNGGASGYAYGGGADLSGAPTITGTTFSGNTATASGTGGYAAGGGFSNGSDECGEEPGISFTGTISGNSAVNAGGGIWNDCSEFTVLQATISGNQVTATQYGSSGYYDGDGGGGIWSDCGSVAITQSTISGNSVAGSVADTGGGGVMNNDGSLTITNSTIASNTSAIDGGGAENTNYASTTFTNVTVYQNKATGKGGSIENGPCDGCDYVSIENTILAGGSAGTGNEVDNEDTFYSYGGNLIQGAVSGDSIPAASEGIADLTGVSPALGTLGSNGGPTQTIPDTSSSPGKGHIPFSGTYCGYNGPSVDQRNYTRGTGSVCDIGAYEFAGTASTQSAARRR